MKKKTPVGSYERERGQGMMIIAKKGYSVMDVIYQLPFRERLRFYLLQMHLQLEEWWEDHFGEKF